VHVYRFPPLDLLQAARSSAVEQLPSEVSGHVPAIDPQAMAQAYDQAVQRGQALGFAQGQQEGLQTGLEQARVQGLQEGKEQAVQTLRESLHRLGEPIDALTAQLQGLHAEWQESLRKDVIDLVERVARQVVRCELTLQPAQILALVEETLQGMPQRTGEVQVYLNPTDLQRIQELDASRIPAWHLWADSNLEAGECRLRVGEEEVDAGCKHRLNACMDQVREQLMPQENL
jgi:flagellar assembly protein FliH